MDSFFIKPGTAHTLSSNKANAKPIDTRINSRPTSSRGGRGGMSSRGGRGGISTPSRGGRGGMSSRGGRGGISSRGGRGGFNNNNSNSNNNRYNKDNNNSGKRKFIPKKDEYYDSDKSSDENQEESEQEESVDGDIDNNMEFHSEDEDKFKSEFNQSDQDSEEEDEESRKLRLKKKLKLSVVEEEETADEKRLRLASEYINKIKEAKLDLDLDEAVREDLEKSSGRYQYSYRDQISKLQLKELVKNSNSSNNNNSKFTIFKGHKSPITCIVLSEDQTIAYSASKDLIIQWDLINKVKLNKIKGFIPSKNNRNEIEQLNKQEKEEFKKTSYQGRILTMALSFDGKYLVTGGEEKLIKVWDTETMSIVETFKGHKDIISALVFRKGTYQLYSGSHDRTVKIWDLTQMAFVDTRYGHQSPITAIDALSRERCITVSTDKTCRVWKIPEESQLIFRGHTHSIDCCALVSEEKFITGSQEGSIALWNVNKKNATFIKNNAHSNNTDLPWITSVASVPNSDIVASGGSDGTLRIWAIMGGEKLREINQIEIDGFINDMKFSRDASFLLVAVAQEHKFGRWKRIKTAKNCLIFINLLNQDDDLNSENSSQDIQQQDEEEDNQEEVEEEDDDDDDN